MTIANRKTMRIIITKTYVGLGITRHNDIHSFFLSFSRATPAAYGGFQARGPIGAVAAGTAKQDP